jgi:hypothetical protein
MAFALGLCLCIFLVFGVVQLYTSPKEIKKELSPQIYTNSEKLRSMERRVGLLECEVNNVVHISLKHKHDENGKPYLMKIISP